MFEVVRWVLCCVPRISPISLLVMRVLSEQEWVGPLCVEILSLSRIFWDTAQNVREEWYSGPEWWSQEW